MNQPKLVVFDLDGTLIDDDCAHDWMHFLQASDWLPAISEPHGATR
jgi:FMN phosphatase YigB (HAD superfamily)